MVYEGAPPRRSPLRLESAAGDRYPARIMPSSEAVTEGIRVRVESTFSPERSRPSEHLWFFVYEITLINESRETVQLLERHWVITDGRGRVEEVRGPGVVGVQPTLVPGDSYRYTSGCPLATSFGTMHGSYRMVTPAGRRFEVEIAPFALSEPYAIN